jgi:hypothetical protein
MSRHAISDAVLKMMIGLRLEVGVGISQIRSVIDRFASDQLQQGHGEHLVGFLSVDDVPQHLRAEFLAELASLSVQPDHRHTSPGTEQSSVKNGQPIDVGERMRSVK